MNFFDPDRLAKIMYSQLEARGVVPAAANHVVNSLIQTSLRGVDSHGINLFPHYCRAVEVGRVNDTPSITVEATAAATALVDADHAFGHHAGAVAMETAIDLALKSGIGAVGVRNSTHFGAAAYFGLMAPERGCLGFAFTNADALVKAFASREAFFGTNPVCFTAPLENEAPLCLDMATSLVSWNKVNNYRREERLMPDDWAFDELGNSVIDPHQARTLNPAGGYKGFGLGMMVDILCAVLTGGLISKDLRPMYELPLDESKRCIGHFVVAINIESFSPLPVFRRTLQLMVDRVRQLPPLDDECAVMVPGDPEKKCFKQRSIEGIPVDDMKLAEFMAITPAFLEVCH